MFKYHFGNEKALFLSFFNLWNLFSRTAPQLPSFPVFDNRVSNGLQRNERTLAYLNSVSTSMSLFTERHYDKIILKNINCTEIYKRRTQPMQKCRGKIGVRHKAQRVQTLIFSPKDSFPLREKISNTQMHSEFISKEKLFKHHCRQLDATGSTLQ